MRIRTLSAVALLLLARPLAGQSNPDSVKHRNDCRLAAQVITHGHPAARRTWALNLLPRCGAAGGQATAAALRGFRSVHTWRSDHEELVMVTSVFHDRAVFDAALDIARDGAAGKAARIQAFRVLYFQLGWGRVDPYESFLVGGATTMLLPLLDYPARTGTPLPGDACERVAAITRPILADARVDADIRAAAYKATCPRGGQPSS